MNKSAKAIAVVTGIKLNELKKPFTGAQYVTYETVDGQQYKMNAAAGVLRQIHDKYEVIGTCYRPEDADRIEALGWLDASRLYTYDLTNKAEAAKFADKIVELKSMTGLPVHIVHYGGASDTQTALPNDSLMAHTWDMRPEALADLITNNCVTLLNLLQATRARGIFNSQAETKIIIVSAAAAVRPKQKLGLDTIQKGAGHSLARTLALDLTPENIYVTEVMPGSTDTGFFDNDFTMDTAIEVSKNMGYTYTRETYPVFTAEQIGDAVKYVLNANCNVREIVLLPYGQFPHLGA